MSEKAITAEEFQVMKHLMSRLNQFGVQSGESAATNAADAPGAMTDACKRHRDCDDELWTGSEYAWKFLDFAC